MLFIIPSLLYDALNEDMHLGREFGTLSVNVLTDFVTFYFKIGGGSWNRTRELSNISLIH
jgi:hypothetical protein